MASYDTNDWKNFAEKLGSSLVDVGREVAGKAKQVGDTANINFKLLEKENELEKLFFELGVECYTKQKEAGVCDCPIMEKIENKQREVRELRDELAAKKGMEVCYQCGEFVDLKAKFCPHCGAQIVFDRD